MNHDESLLFNLETVRFLSSKNNIVSLFRRIKISKKKKKSTNNKQSQFQNHNYNFSKQTLWFQQLNLLALSQFYQYTNTKYLQNPISLLTVKLFHLLFINHNTTALFQISSLKKTLSFIYSLLLVSRINFIFIS